jgi:L-lactate dehydrogenase complex protein LldG
MATAREVMLGKIRAAIQQGTPTTRTSITHDYLVSDPLPQPELIERFVERVEDYKARVHVVAEAMLPITIATALQERGVQRLVVPADLPAHWIPPAIQALPDTGQLGYAELETCDGVLTGCALGVAQTGTIILDCGAYQGRRVISLLPDYHLCIVRSDQIVSLIPAAITALNQPERNRRPITFISGPSATSDIELNRVEGVHGPRTLEVIVVT